MKPQPLTSTSISTIIITESPLWLCLFPYYSDRRLPLTGYFSIAQSSGVTANQACLEAYQSLKLGKKYRYIIYNLSKDNKEIVVEQTAERSSGDAISQYEEFLTHLSEAECRWAVYDFEFEKEDGGKRSKIVFFSW